MNEKNNIIEKYIINAKIGNKDAYKTLRCMFDFICEDVFNAYLQVYEFLRYAKYDFYFEYYSVYWKVINDYRFNDDFNFPYLLKERIINKTNDILINNFKINENLILSRNTLETLLRCSKPPVSRKKTKIAFNRMTIKQTESMLLYYYENHSLAKCSEILGITYWNLNRRIKGAYLRIKYALGKVKKGKKRIKYRERVYKIVEIKI